MCKLGTSKSMALSKLARDSAFTLIELILVIALVGILFTMAAPNLTILSSTEAAQKLGTLAGDIRAAFDMAILHRRPHRLVFQLSSGDYWLETTNAEEFFLGSERSVRDLSKEELEDLQEEVNAEFEEYRELAGVEVQLPDAEDVTPPTSPVLQAQSQLMPPKWRKVEDSEWKKRSVGPFFVFHSIQAEHHDQPIRLEDFGEEGFAHLYFLPQGYVERAVIYVYPSNYTESNESENQPYTITTKSYEGVAEVQSGYIEVDIFDEARR